jgi:Zn-dependent protease
MRIGLATGSFVPASPSFTQIVGPATEGGIADGVAIILSIFFSLNILLGFFNLIPFPPLDGYGVLGLFTSESGALRLQEFRVKMGVFSILGLVVAWQLFDRLYPTIFVTGLRLFYRGYRF